MKPIEFISFKEKLPAPDKWIIVTNNLHSVDANGEMSHVWLVNWFEKGAHAWEGIVTFTWDERKVIGLTHWKYA